MRIVAGFAIAGAIDGRGRRRPTSALVWANTFAPGLTDRMVKRFGRKPLRAR